MAVSRSLGQRQCRFCGMLPDVFGEKHPITENEAKAKKYYDEYRSRGLIVAQARCPACLAQYWAWVSIDGVDADRDLGHLDLSFYSTFSDEPGSTDKPYREFTVLRDTTEDPTTYILEFGDNFRLFITGKVVMVQGAQD